MRPYRSVLLLVLLAGCNGAGVSVDPAGLHVRSAMPDVSGLAWVDGHTFLVVHDAKTPEEDDRPRVSLVELAPGVAPVWTPLTMGWPAGGPPSHDLESIARIPGTSTYLLVESGDGGSAHQRIFVADLDAQRLEIREAADWPVPVHDVEGTAVIRRGEALYLVFAERAHGERATEFVWGHLELGPLRLGSLSKVPFENLLMGCDTRAVSAVEVDREGRLYVAAAYDPGDDGGPFRSAVWEAGRFTEQGEGGVELGLLAEPIRLATLDGLKVEALTLDEDRGLVVGTDDENFGGMLRRLP